MRFTIKTNYYLYSLLKIEWGLRKDVFVITDLIGLQIKDLLEYNIWNISPGFRVYAASRPEWQWKGNAG